MNKTAVFNMEQGNWKPHPAGFKGVFLQGILSGDEGLGFKTAYVKVVPGGEIITHTHEVTEVFYIISGTGSVLTNGEIVECQAGAVIAAPAGVEHGVKNNTDKEVLLLANFEA